MSTTRRENKSLPWIFKGRRERTGHRKTCDAFPATEPYLRIIRFQGRRAVKKKRELFPGPRRRLRVRLRCRHSIHVQVREY